MNTTSDFAARLRALRAARSLTLAELGAASGLHAMTVGRYERGERVPDLTVLGALARALEVEPGTLLSGPIDVCVRTNESPEAA